ncbi:MAG: hypothetical protein FWG75_06435 [Cystobacterineae bacterium]|nr:hypothetical protein [Cystobacterineae bacterium]
MDNICQLPGTCTPTCTHGQVCINGTCRTESPATCTNSNDCAEAEICVSGICQLPGPERCENGGTLCPGDEVCISDVCRIVCIEDSDCSSIADAVCVAGVCRVPDDNCTPPCNNEQVCVDSSCQPRGPALCTNNNDCSAIPGTACVDGICQLPGTCTPACSAGQVCINGTCRTQSPGTCNNSNECAEAEVCVDGTCQLPGTCNPACENEQVCINGSCRTQWPTECIDSSQCAETEACVDNTCQLTGTCTPACSAGQVCINGTCRTESPGTCNNSNECAEAEACVDGTCQLTGTCTPPCSTGQVCINGTCRTEWPATCTDNNQCTEAETCEDNICQLMDLELCRYGGTICPPREICINRNCVPDPNLCENGGTTCSTGLVCVNGTCVADALCEDGGTICPFGQACVNRHCHAICVGNGDCSGTNELCINGVCRTPDEPALCNPPCNNPQICVDNACQTPGSGLCEEDNDCFDGRVCQGGICRRPTPEACTPACGQGQICVYHNRTQSYGCRDEAVILNACRNPLPIGIRRNFAAQIAMGLPMSFVNSYVDIQRGTTRGLMGFDGSRNVAFLAWRHMGPAVGNLSALRQLATDHASSIGGSAVTGAFTSWDAATAEANALEVTFSIPGNMSPPERVNAIATALLGAGAESLTDTSASAATQYVQAQYVLRSNGTVIVVMAVALDNTPGSFAAFGLEDVAGGAALASYLDYSMKQCDSFIASSSGRVDFLFVVDDSASMSTKQSQLASAITTMATSLNSSALEWRAALVTSSYHLSSGGGSNRNIIRGFTSDPQQLQAWLRRNSTCNAARVCTPGCILNASGTCSTSNHPAWATPAPTCGGTNSIHGTNGGCWIGISGSASEGMLGAARWALMQLNCSDDPNRCLRDDAEIVVVILSDADDQTTSLRSSGTASNREAVQNFIDFFQGNPNARAKNNPTGSTITYVATPPVRPGAVIPVHAIYCPAGATNCGDDSVSATVPTRIQAIVEATGGVLGDIRNANGVPLVMRAVVEREIGYQGVVLRKPFIGASLRVALENPAEGNVCDATDVPRSRANGFDYDGMYQSISFFGACRPNPDSEVAVSYQTWETWTPD